MVRPIEFSDLLETKPRAPAPISPGERRRFLEAVDAEMTRLGYDEQNKLTAGSVVLDERDYQVYINL